MAKRRHKHDGRSDLVKSDGALVMTFVNTGSRRSPDLRDYGDLLQWSVLHGDLTMSDARRLELLVADQPLQADTGFAAAEDLHVILSQILNARADGASPSAVAVDELNKLLVKATPRRILVPGAAVPPLELARRRARCLPAAARRDPVGDESSDQVGLRQGHSLRR